jgi:anti-anti-sigma factor
MRSDRAAQVSHPSALPGDADFSALGKRHDVQLDTRWKMSSVAIVSARGDIDGTNAGTLTDYALANVARCRGLVLDLSCLEFFGTEGFSALHRVSVCCAGAGTSWVLVSGAAVSRVLRICDPHGLLPAVDTVGAALASLRDQLHRPLLLNLDRSTSNRYTRPGVRHPWHGGPLPTAL